MEHSRMRPVNLAILFLTLVACAPDTYEGDYTTYDAHARSAWDTLWWDVLDDVYGTGDSECYYAIDSTAVVVTSKAELARIGCSSDTTGCVVSNFFGTGTPGAHTIGLLETAGHGVLCHTLYEELVHIADNCLAREHDGWPFSWDGHPEALFDWDNPKSVLSRLDEAEWEACRNG